MNKHVWLAKQHPSKNAKSRAPASENAIRFFCKVIKHCACHAKWTCSNSLVAAGQNAFFELKHRKKGFRLHEEQNSKGTNDNCGDGETRVLRVYIYIPIYIYCFFFPVSFCFLKHIQEKSAAIRPPPDASELAPSQCPAENWSPKHHDLQGDRRPMPCKQCPIQAATTHIHVHNFI